MRLLPYRSAAAAGDLRFDWAPPSGGHQTLVGRRLDPEDPDPQPHGLDPPPIPLDQYRWMVADEAGRTGRWPSDDGRTGRHAGPSPPHQMTPSQSGSLQGGRLPNIPGPLQPIAWKRRSEGRPPLGDQNGRPIIQRGIDSMMTGFKKLDPKPPSDRYIRQWIKNNPARTNKWWGDDT